jgi:ArsR family transcriptional regulator
MEQTINDDMLMGIFSALSDKTRLNIVKELLNGEKPCSELIQMFSLSKSTFSHHAKVLAKSGLVKFRRESKFLFFSLNNKLIDELKQLFLNTYFINERKYKNGKIVER